MRKYIENNNLKSTNIERDFVRKRLDIEMHSISINDNITQSSQKNKPIKNAGKKRVIQYAKLVKINAQQIISALEKIGYKSAKIQTLISNREFNELLCRKYIQSNNIRSAIGNIDNIEFFDGYYLVWYMSNNSHSLTPLYLSDKNSQRCFNLLKKYLERQICHSFIVYYTDNCVIGINPILTIEKYIQELRIAIKKEWNNQIKEEVAKNTILEFKNQSERDVELGLLCKNIFIDYLSVLHNYRRVYKCYEVINNQKEDCFIFSIKIDNNAIAIIFENITFARATEVFITRNEQYDESIESIFSFFISPIHNKREMLRKQQIATKQLCVTKYYSIVHYDIQNWQLSINNIINTHEDLFEKFQFKAGLKTPKNVEADINSKSYKINNLHNRILKALFNKLNAEYPNHVGSEIQITDNKRIDVVVKLQDGSFAFYEVKPYSDPLKCIQEGIGQLMNYKFLVRKSCVVSKLIVVGTNKPCSKILDYIKMYNSPELPISYMQIQFDTKETE